MSVTGDLFGIWITFSSSHWFGTCAWQKDALNRAVTGSEISFYEPVSALFKKSIEKL